MPSEFILEKLKSLPLKPGCYIFKNREGQIIYIGKSKALRNRVRQYFQGVDKKEGKYLMLLHNIHDFEIIETESETDALILECQLIKTHLPRYNVQMKRTKHFAYIRITIKEAFPGISITREVGNDGSRYFGFFYNEEDAKRTIQLINHIWKTPVCGKEHFQQVGKPCLNQQIGKCVGPCSREIDQVAYQKMIREICNFLMGRSKARIRLIEKEMKQAAKTMDYEKAALYRDYLYHLGILVRKSKRLNVPLKSHDVFLFFRGFHEPRCTLFFIRDGNTLARLDIVDLEKPEITRLFEYLERIKEGDFEIQEGEFLTTCLLAIFADKYFIPAPARWKKETMAEQLVYNFLEFTATEKSTI